MQSIEVSAIMIVFLAAQTGALLWWGGKITEKVASLDKWRDEHKAHHTHMEAT